MTWPLRLAWLALGLSIASFGCSLGPTINQDSLFGLFVARDVRAGGLWNQLILPDLTDLAQSRSAFLAWWAPAQWVVPDLFQRAGLSLGWALVITTAGGLVSGFLGLARLYRRLGYNNETVAWSLLFLACSAAVWRRSSDYHGGEVLLFGLLPWIVLAALSIGLSRHALWLLPLLFLLGGLVKLSFSIVALATVGMLWLRDHAAAPRTVAAGRAAALAGASFLIFYAAFVAGYQARGVTPNSVYGEKAWFQLPVMAAGPLSFLLGGETMTGRLMPAVEGRGLVVAMVTASAITLWLAYRGARSAPSAAARSVLIAFYAANVTAIAFMYWRGNRVWFIDRIFMPAGLMLLPALVQVARRDAFAPARWCTGGLLVAGTLFSVMHACRFHAWQRTHTAGSAQHIRHFGLTEAQLERWVGLDAHAPPGALAVFVDPAAASLGLEWPHWRRFVPAYAAIGGRDLLMGGPAAWRGQPAALAVCSFTDSSPAAAAERWRARFVDVDPAAWRGEVFDRIQIWTVSP